MDDNEDFPIVGMMAFQVLLSSSAFAEAFLIHSDKKINFNGSIHYLLFQFLDILRDIEHRGNWDKILE